MPEHDFKPGDKIYKRWGTRLIRLEVLDPPHLRLGGKLRMRNVDTGALRTTWWRSRDNLPRDYHLLEGDEWPIEMR